MCMMSSANVLSLNKCGVLCRLLGLLLRLMGNHEVFLYPFILGLWDWRSTICCYWFALTSVNASNYR